MAGEIIRAAALGDGHVLYSTHFGTPSSGIQAGERSMIPDDADHRTEVGWTDALRELLKLGYLQDLGAGSVFELTPKGYSAADDLLPRAAQHRVWLEINLGKDGRGSIPSDERARSIIEKRGGKYTGGGWRFPDGTILPELDGRLVAS